MGSNKKFMKKNLGMVVCLSGLGAVSLVLLVVALIYGIELFTVVDEIKKNAAEINSIRRANRQVSVGDANIKLIDKDVELLRKETIALRTYFRSPLQSAINAFIKELAPPVKSLLKDDERELYQVPPPEDYDGVSPRVQVMRKLTLEEFKEFFIRRFNEHSPDANRRLDVQNVRSFVYQFRQIFPNWQKAVQKFTEEADKHLVERVTEQNALPLLFYGMGFRRAVESDPSFISLVNFREAIEAVIEKNAGEDKQTRMVWDSGARNFLVTWGDTSATGGAGGGNSAGQNDFAKITNLQDRSLILFHWEQLGYIAKVLSASKIAAFTDIAVFSTEDPAAAADTQQRGAVAALPVNVSATFRDIGNGYESCRYAIEVLGSMENIRKAVHAFDMAHKTENRIFLVRAVALYAENDEAKYLIDNKNADFTAEAAAAAGMMVGRQEAVPEQSTPFRSRRTRRTRRTAGQPQQPQEGAQAAAGQNPFANLKPEQRPDYGVVRIGDTRVKALILLDYIMLKRQDQQ